MVDGCKRAIFRSTDEHYNEEYHFQPESTYLVEQVNNVLATSLVDYFTAKHKFHQLVMFVEFITDDNINGHLQ